MPSGCTNYLDIMALRFPHVDASYKWNHSLSPLQVYAGLCRSPLSPETLSPHMHVRSKTSLPKHSAVPNMYVVQELTISTALFKSVTSFLTTS